MVGRRFESAHLHWIKKLPDGGFFLSSGDKPHPLHPSRRICGAHVGTGCLRQLGKGSAGRLMAASEQPNLELRSNLRSQESVVERIFSKSNFTKPSISLNTVKSFQFATEHLCTTFCIWTTFPGSTP